VSAKEEMRQKL